MLIVKMICLAIGTVLAVLFILLTMRGKKEDWRIEGVPEKEFSDKELWAAGFAMQQMPMFSMDSAVGKKMISASAILHPENGGRFVEYWARLYWARTLSMSLLVLALAFCAAVFMDGYMLFAVLVAGVALKKGEIMLSKMKKSVVICMNSLISVIIFCMIIMLLCSCVSAARTTWKQAKKTYHSMVEYYTRDVENNLRNISDYLLRISETADYYGMTNCEEDKESMNNLSRQRLYNQLNEDILVYSSADYFFIFQDKYADIMMVESAKKKAKIQSQNIREQLKRLLESREPTEKWELFDAEGYQYLIRVVSKDGVGIGCAVSLNRLIETMQAVQLSDYYVSYYKIGTMILDNESGKDLKIELPIQETDVGVRIVIPSEKLFEEIRTLLNFSMVFAAILIILLFALYISMYHWFTNPVNRIVSVMQKVDEEGIDLKMPEFDNWEEYHIVSKNFNNMMEKIKILKIDVYEKEKKQSELYKQYLMLQINPHFFLNALNTIYMLNKRKDNNQVNILLTYLINYFKSVFARQGEMVPLKEEINFMLNYMAIQKFRFAGAMHLQCEIEPEAEISMVPAMCVLTFVENAIKYSTDFSNDLMIVVSAKVEGDNIKIEIQDNGEGIEENILKKINQNEKIVKNDREHIGIKNIVDRMHMHYGEAASVKVTNRDSGGVSVVINVPK